MHEFPLIEKQWKKDIKTMAIVYPNLYYGGVYCLGPLIIYNLVNQLDNWICERIFLDRQKLLNHDLVGFTWQYELDIKNIIEIINKYRPKITFAGGPCVNFNTKPLEPYMDFFVLGDSEDILPKVLDKYTDDKKIFLKNILNIPGVYIPNKNKPIKIVSKLSSFYPLYQPLPDEMNKNFVFGRAFILEVERGCPFKCDFCSFKEQQPRYRSFNDLKEIIDKGLKINQRDKVVIYSASFTHPQKKEILKYLIEKNIKFSIPSIKIETVDSEILKLIKTNQKSLTIAPECGESLRRKIGKFVKDEDFFKFARVAKVLGFKDIKLYFMVGLPNQKKEDLDEMISFIDQFKTFFPNIYISINPYVYKPTTYLPHKFNREEIKQQIKYLKRFIKNRLKISSVSSAEKIYDIIHSLE